MNFDRNALNNLLSLNDKQLAGVIEKLASDSGISLADFNITSNDISSIRKALSEAGDEDILRANDQINSYMKNRRQK